MIEATALINKAASQAIPVGITIADNLQKMLESLPLLGGKK